MNKDIIIFDVDGTISDSNHRLHYIHPDKSKGEKGNFRAFLDSAKDDPLVTRVAQMYKLLYVVYPDIRVVTGRPESLRQVTLDWFAQHGLPLATENLYMRKQGDNRRDFLIKQEIFNSWKISPEQVFCVFEDRLQVVAMWESLGIQVFVCGGGYQDHDNYQFFERCTKVTTDMV